MLVLLGHAHHEAQIAVHHLFLGFLAFLATAGHSLGKGHFLVLTEKRKTAYLGQVFGNGFF